MCVHFTACGLYYLGQDKTLAIGKSPFSILHLQLPQASLQPSFSFLEHALLLQKNLARIEEHTDLRKS